MTMIGKPKRTFRVEPLEDPVAATRPKEPVPAVAKTPAEGPAPNPVGK